MQNINKNLTFWGEAQFSALPVMSDNQPLIYEFLESLTKVVDRSLRDYNRVFAFRVDLRLPEGVDASPDRFSNNVMTRFVNSFKAKIEHNRSLADRHRNNVHHTKVRYFWVREVGDEGRVHYHAVLLLNGDAYNWLGPYGKGPNTASRICEAWASALRVPESYARALVHFPVNPTYTLRRDSQESIDNFFYRASYLCKARTKLYGNGHHGCGCSRL